MSEAVQDARPPMLALWFLNPIMRVVLRSPLGHLVKPFGLLEFSGRRSGRRYRVPVGIYRVDDAPVVFTPAAWRANFSDDTSVTMYHRGQSLEMAGTLVTDPSEVARALRSVLATGTPDRLLGLGVPRGHEVSATDVASLGRAMIRLQAPVITDSSR